MVMLQMRFDMRYPTFAATPLNELYATALEQAAWAEQHAFDGVVVSEHHASEDGFLPSPLTMCGAIAARTVRVPITIAALLVPLHDPLRLAEDLAVLDHLSGGRVITVAGLGYRREEYEMLGVPWKGRGKRLEHCLEAMMRAWTGEPFEHEGRGALVRPKPLTEPHPLVLIGGSSEAAAERAARMQLGFFPAVGDQALLDHYLEACREHGWEGFGMLPHGPGFVHVTDDPERTWAQIGKHLLHDARTYASWQTDDIRSAVHETAETVEGLRDGSVYEVVTPDECVALAERLGDAGTLVFHPLAGGIPPDLAWESLELFASQVLPRIRPDATTS